MVRNEFTFERDRGLGGPRSEREMSVSIKAYVVGILEGYR